ncbi:hypothetical protein D3C86_1831460 [compost metagenome]
MIACVTANVTLVMLLADTVTSAVCVPTANPSLARTVKLVAVAPLFKVEAGCVMMKLLALSPLRATLRFVKVPVPVFEISMVFVSCVPAV